MVTCVQGQVVVQRINMRKWRLVAPATNDPRSGVRRWTIELIDVGLTPDRVVGERTNITERWLNENCDDFPERIDAPCGNGEQLVRICSSDRTIISERSFSRAEDAVTYINEHLLVGMHAEWFGWLAEGEQVPDLIAHLNETGDLVWAELLARAAS